MVIRTMKTVLIIIGILLAIGFCAFLLPAIIGIAAGIALFKSGHFIWAIICMFCGIGINIGMLVGEYSGGGCGYHEEDCPYCGSGDTDGNHCYNCDDDF